MNEFRFANPKYLLLLLLLAAVFFLLRRIRSSGRTRLAKFVSRENLSRLLKTTGSKSEKGKRLALWAGLALLVLALARPQANPQIEDVEGMSLDVYVLLDLSRSMDAEDTPPSRLRKAKRSVQHLLDLLPGDRVGIIGFAGTSALLVPLTSDYEIVKSVLQNIDSSLIPSQGTNLGGALELAKSAMQRGAQVVGSNGASRTNIFIVMSDGEDHAAGDLSIADSIQSDGGLIFTIAYGTEKGVPIPVRNDRGELMGYKRDAQGNTVMSTVQAKSLTEIAQRGGGQFYYSTLEEKEIEDIMARVKTAQRSGAMLTKAKIYQELFVPLLFASLALLLYSFISVRALWRKRSLPWRKVAVALIFCLPQIASANPLSLLWNKEKRVSEKSELLAKEGKPEAAADQLKALQAENPDSPAINYNLGTYLLDAKKMEEGREQLNRVAKDQGYFQAEALYNLAGSYMLEKKRPQAIAGYADLIRRLEHKKTLIGKEKDILQKARESLALLSNEDQKNPQNQQSDSQQSQQGGEQEKKDQQSKGGGGEGDKKEENKDQKKDESGSGKDSEKKDEKKEEGKDQEKKENDKESKDDKNQDKQDGKDPGKNEKNEDQQSQGQQGTQNMPLRKGGQPFKERDNISEADAKRILESLKEQEGTLQKKFLKKSSKDSKVVDDANGQDW